MFFFLNDFDLFLTGYFIKETKMFPLSYIETIMKFRENSKLQWNTRPFEFVSKMFSIYTVRPVRDYLYEPDWPGRLA